MVSTVKNIFENVFKYKNTDNIIKILIVLQSMDAN